MSEQSVIMDVSSQVTDSYATLSGAGAMLRAAREAQGLHIAMLSVSLKVPVRKLEALESDQYDLLPDLVFVRALAASVCRALRIDVEPVLAALPQLVQPQIRIDEMGLNAAYDDGSTKIAHSWSQHIRKPLSVTVAFVIFAILGIVFLPDEWFGKNWPTSKLLESHPALAGKSDNTQPADTPIPFASSPAYVQPLDSVDLSANISPPMPKASSDTTAVVNQKPLIPIANTPSGNNALVLSAIGDSWVEVRDAQGIVQLSRILNKGETIHVSGTLPLFVVLGRAELVTVLVRGQPFDTAGLTKENVARFEVK